MKRGQGEGGGRGGGGYGVGAGANAGEGGQAIAIDSKEAGDSATQMNHVHIDIKNVIHSVNEMRTSTCALSYTVTPQLLNHYGL